MHGLRFLPVLLLALLAGCDPSPATARAAPPGSVRVTVSTREALAASAIERVSITVWAADLPELTTDLAPTEDGWGGVLGDIPAGARRSFRARAFDAAGTARYEAQVQGIPVEAGRTGLVALRLNETVAPSPFTNGMPLLDALLAPSSSVVPGGRLSLRAVAHDPDPGDTLSYQWTAPTGSFSAPTQAQTDWTAPTAKGPVTLTLTVTDSRGAAFTTPLTLNVAAGWTPTGSPLQGRSSHTALLLADGRVLVTRGKGANAPVDNYLMTSELYDPTTGTWSATGDSYQGTTFASLTRLPDGQALWVGGIHPEIFNPTTGTWRAAPPLGVTLLSHTATALLDGQVLVVGESSSDKAEARVYDPASNTWRSTGVPRQMRYGKTATRLPDGKVLIVGGYPSSLRDYFATAELYDPATETWSATGSMAAPRADHQAVLLSDGQVLVVGGFRTSRTDRNPTAELYDPATGTWRVTGSPSGSRSSMRAVRLADGRVLVAGGYGERAYSPAAELYDPATGTWSATGSLWEARGSYTLTALADGTVLAVGGTGVNDGDLYNPEFIRSAELYVP